MSSPTFGLPGTSTPGTSNNAPLPIPGNTNPTGTNAGVGFNTGSTFPNYPLFGSSNTGVPGPSANAPLWSGTSGGLADLNSGLGVQYGQGFGTEFYNLLGKSFGKGAGQLLGNIFSNGLFNPQVAAAFLNAMGPSEARGLANVQNSFGAEGSRFGSAAALGIGDYQSQVNLNEQQTLASMYMNAQQEELTLLGAVLPTLHQERADSGFMHDFSQFSTLMAGITNLGTPFSVSQPPAMPGASPQQPSGGAAASTPNFGNAAGATTGSDFGTMGVGGGIDSFVGGSSGGAALGGASSVGDLGALGALFA
jgi:hypothetical protein